jgi:hypothetical protein
MAIDLAAELVRIGRMGGVLRVRAGAEGSRRAADGCRQAVRQAEEHRPCSLLWAHAGPGGLSSKGAARLLNTTPTAVAPAREPASQAQMAVLDAPEWRSPHRELSGTPAPGACHHTSRRPTRPALSVLRRSPAKVQSWCALLLRLLHRCGNRRALLLRLRFLLGSASLRGHPTRAVWRNSAS